MKRRNFTREFKLSVLNELSSKPAAEICREHNLGANLLSKWKRDYESNPREAFKGNGSLWKEDARIAQYERLIGRLYAEIDFLKKMNANLEERRAEEKRRCMQ